MSAPTDQLRNLSIQGGMPTTRAQARRAQGGAEGERSGDEDDLETVEGDSGVTYDNRELSPAAWRRVLEGVQGDFDVSFCAKHNSYYAFEITEDARASVRIWDNNKTCSCSDFQERGRTAACKHIFWLLEQLNGISGSEIESPLSLKRDGSTEEVPGPYDSISLQGLERIAEQLDWPLRRHGNESIPDRKRALRDILSVFDPHGTLPEDYRPDIYDAVPDSGLDEDADTIVQHDFEATIFRMAVEDDILFARLRKTVSADTCARAYMEKVQKQASGAFEALDAYVQHGPSADDPSSRLDVLQCAAKLRKLVASIQTNLKLRAPLTQPAKAFAAKLLVWILDRVCTRNVDAYAAVTWAPAPAPDSPHARNLYLQLVGSPAPSAFVLDALLDLADVSRDMIEQLTKILDKVRAYGAPAPYVRKIQECISNSQKRRGPGDGRGSASQKRMK